MKPLRSILSLLKILLTGGKYGRSIPSAQTSRYTKSQEQREKDFAKHGGKPCKICSARIPANKHYCAPCYFTYKKKS